MDGSAVGLGGRQFHKREVWKRNHDFDVVFALQGNNFVWASPTLRNIEIERGWATSIPENIVVHGNN